LVPVWDELGRDEPPVRVETNPFPTPAAMYAVVPNGSEKISSRRRPLTTFTGNRPFSLTSYWAPPTAKIIARVLL
jgi:hypothetical protein